MEVSRATVTGTAPASRRRVLLATCAAGLFLAAWAPNAYAQKTSKTRDVNKEFQTTLDSPCTHETVDIEGRQVTQTKTQQNGNLTKFTFKVETNGKGLGRPVPQKEYRYLQMAQDISVSSSTCTFYVRNTSREHLIRQGNRPQIADDFFAKSRFLLKMTKDCQTELTVESFDAAECR
jgi:hypothetical protein